MYQSTARSPYPLVVQQVVASPLLILQLPLRPSLHSQSPRRWNPQSKAAEAMFRARLEATSPVYTIAPRDLQGKSTLLRQRPPLQPLAWPRGPAGKQGGPPAVVRVMALSTSRAAAELNAAMCVSNNTGGVQGVHGGAERGRNVQDSREPEGGRGGYGEGRYFQMQSKEDKDWDDLSNQLRKKLAKKPVSGRSALVIRLPISTARRRKHRRCSRCSQAKGTRPGVLSMLRFIHCSDERTTLGGLVGVRLIPRIAGA